MYKRKAWIVVIALALAVIAVLLILRGDKKNVMFVCDGFVSDDVLLDTFETYQKKYRPFAVQPKPTYISFDVDFPVKSCRVTRLSSVDAPKLHIWALCVCQKCLLSVTGVMSVL